MKKDTEWHNSFSGLITIDNVSTCAIGTVKINENCQIQINRQIMQFGGLLPSSSNLTLTWTFVETNKNVS